MCKLYICYLSGFCWDSIKLCQCIIVISFNLNVLFVILLITNFSKISIYTDTIIYWKKFSVLKILLTILKKSSIPTKIQYIGWYLNMYIGFFISSLYWFFADNERLHIWHILPVANKCYKPRAYIKRWKT